MATKALHTRAAVEAARDALADAAVVSVQNGIGNEEVVAETCSRASIRGSIVTAGHVTEPGAVRYDAPGDSWFGPFEPSPARADEIATLADLLTEGGLRTLRAGRRPRAAVDQGGLQRRHQRARRADRADGRPGVHRPRAAGRGGPLIAEALAVCAAAGIELTRDPAESVQEAIEEAFWHKPSMLQDVLAPTATEVDVLNGGIAAEGRRVGVPTPLHDAMVALVHGLESSW